MNIANKISDMSGTKSRHECTPGGTGKDTCVHGLFSRHKFYNSFGLSWRGNAMRQFAVNGESPTHVNKKRFQCNQSQHGGKLLICVSL